MVMFLFLLEERVANENVLGVGRWGLDGWGGGGGREMGEGDGVR